MIIKGIFAIKSNEIIFSRCRYDYRTSMDGRVGCDGGIECERIIGNKEDFIEVELDGDVMLTSLLYYDWKFGNSNSDKFPNGFYGKFELFERSNYSFYKKLITKGFEEVWKSHIEGLDKDGN